MADRKDYQFYMLIWRNWQYASDLSSDGGNTVWVRLPLSAPFVPPPDTINRELIVENRSKSGNSRETPFGQG